MPTNSLEIPWLDRETIDVPLTQIQQHWRVFGYALLPGIIPQILIDEYCAVWEQWNTWNMDPDSNSGADLIRSGGWPIPTPYMQIPEIKNLALYPPVMEVLKDLVGEEVGLHLNLTGWKSTERNWHQDSYLNPPFVNSWYLATWVALDDISADVGPFQFIPGSHRWPVLRREKVQAYLTDQEKADPAWPKTSERFVTPAIEAEIKKRGATHRSFYAKKGDVLIWHANLIHRGSAPKMPAFLRKACISHYSAVTKRQDMKEYQRHNGQVYFIHHHDIGKKISET